MGAAEKIPKDFMLEFPRPVKTYHREPYPRLNPRNSSFKGAGKTVLVTAGGTGIGFEIARAFAATGISHICLLARRSEVLAKAKQALEIEFSGIHISTFPVSLTDYAAIEDTVKQVGQIDVLALSAAAAATEHPLAKTPLSEMETTYNTNILGNWNLVKAVLNARADKYPQTTILNVSSWAAYRPISRQAVYGSSKAAFAQLMTEWSKEFDEKEVRFVSYHPGAIYTEMASEHFPKEVFDGWESVVLPGQFAVWLASPEAGFLNGRFVWAEWDVDELIQVEEKILEDPYFLKISLVQ